MSTIAYTNPFVPPEWIAAHGVRPKWMRLVVAKGGPAAMLRRGVCPYAAEVVDAALTAENASAVVLTTTCDQMRYAAARLQQNGELPVFLMNVPSTWQTATARQLYRDELVRLGRFVELVGGIAPTTERLVDAMLRYDRGRTAVLEQRQGLSARKFAEALVGARGAVAATEPTRDEVPVHSPAVPASVPEPGAPSALPPGTSVPLALVGGPLMMKDYEIFDLVEQVGGRVVLDGSEGGERTMPARFDRERVRDDPLGELIRAYFDTIPDVFRRPNTALHRWIDRHVRARHVRGIVFRRYVWCDLWHAELGRMRQSSSVPVLEIDVDRDDGSAQGRTRSRLEAFMEMLQGTKAPGSAAR